MQCECPAIVSDIKTHRWVMGDAAMYCNPYDVDSICESMKRMIALPDSPQIRTEYIEKGNAFNCTRQNKYKNCG